MTLVMSSSISFPLHPPYIQTTVPHLSFVKLSGLRPSFRLRIAVVQVRNELLPMEESFGNEDKGKTRNLIITGKGKLTRSGGIRKPTDEILRSDPEKSLRFLTELKKHGDSIVEPQNLSVVIDALKSDDTDDAFKGVLHSTLEVLVLPGKIALVLKYNGAWEYIEISDDVDVIAEMTRSDYGILRQEILNPSMGAQEALHNKGVVSQPRKAQSTKKHPLKKAKQ